MSSSRASKSTAFVRVSPGGLYLRVTNLPELLGAFERVAGGSGIFLPSATVHQLTLQLYRCGLYEISETSAPLLMVNSLSGIPRHVYAATPSYMHMRRVTANVECRVRGLGDTFASEPIRMSALYAGLAPTEQ